MGKKRSPVFKIEDAIKSMGVPDLANSQSVQKLNQDRIEQHKARAYDPNVLQDPYQNLKYDKEIYGELLTPGQFSMDQTGINDAISENQGVFSRIRNGLARIIPLTGTKFLGQTAALGAQLDSATGMNGGEEMAYDNLSKKMQAYEEMEATIKNEWLPIYEKTAYQDMPLVEQLGTSQFWVDTVGDGVAFVAATAVGTKGLGGAAGTIGKAFSWIPASERIVKLGNMATTLGIAGANATMNASLQGEQAYRQVYTQLQNTVNPNTGVNYTTDEAKDKASKAAAETFTGTFWVHTVPAMWETRTLLALGKPLEGAVGTTARKKLVDQLSSGKISIEDIYKNPSKYLSTNPIKAGLKKAGEGAIIEGPYEENIENAVVSTAVDRAINNTSGDIKDTIASYLDNMLGNFKDKESLTEMVVGSIIGGGMGMISGASEARAFNKATTDYVNGMQAADNLYLENVDAPFKKYDVDGVTESGSAYKKGDMILDASGTPIIDLKALTKLSKQVIADQNLSDSAFNSVITNNPETLWMNENLSLSSSVFSEMARAEAFGDSAEGAMDLLALRLEKRIDELQEMENASPEEESSEVAGAPSPAVAKSNALLSQRKNNIRKRLTDLSNAYKDVNKRVAKLERVSPSEQYSRFLNVTKKALFYEATKRLSYDGLVANINESLADELSDKEQLANQITAIMNERNKSLEFSRNLLNNPEESYRQWDSYNNFLTTNDEVKTRLSQKQSLTDTEKSELDTADFNIGMALFKSGTFADFADPRITLEPVTRVNEDTGRRTEVYENIGKELLETDKLNEALDNKNYDAALNHLSKLSEKNEQAIGKIEDLLVDKKREIDSVDNDITEILNNDEEIDEFNPASFTPELQEKFTELDKLKMDLQQLDQLKSMAVSKDGPQYSKSTPAEVEDLLTNEYIDNLLSRPRHIVNIALEGNAEVKEDFVDVNSVDRSIKDTEIAIAGMLYTNFLDNLDEALSLLATLKRIREQAILNQNNRLGKQKAIAEAHASLLVDTISTSGVLPIFNEVLGGNASVRLDQIKALKENRLEGTLSLIQYIKEKGKSLNIKKAVKNLRNSAREDFKTKLSESTSNISPILKQFKKNPSASLMSAWLKLNYEQQAQYGLIDISKGSPYSKFESAKDYNQLLNLIEVTPNSVLGVDKEILKGLVNSAKQAEGAIKLGLLMEAPSDILTEMLSTAGEVEFVPTPQQEIAVREIVSWMNSKHSSTPYSNWGYLRGVAGTGKTGIALNWALRLSGIPSEGILGIARIENAANVLSESIGSKAIVFDQLQEADITDNTSLIVIDEYATIDTQQLRAFENNIRLLNQTREHKISVLLLGDPTQITPNGTVEFDLTEVRADNSDSHKTENIQHFTPLTVVYRSDISGVNEVSDAFQGNRKEVPSLSVRASGPIDSPLAVGSHVTSSPGSIIDTITRNQNEENDKGIKPRSRAIIVGTKEQAAKYDNVPNVDVLWVVDAQSRTYDEVYVDINLADYPNIPSRNTALYTAVSRAKKYAQVVYKGTNTNDSSLLSELNKNLGDLQLAKDEFIERKTAEKTFLEDLRNGKPLKTTTPQKPVSAVTTVAPSSKVTASEAEELVDTEEEFDIENEEESSIFTLEEGVGISNEAENREEVSGEVYLLPSGETPQNVTSEKTGTGSRFRELNVDTAIYNAIKNGDVDVDSPIVYMLNEEGNIVSLVFSTKLNKWIDSGFYSKENNFAYLPEALKDKLAGKKNSPKGFLKEINRPNNIWSINDLSKHSSFVGSGNVRSLELMNFNYSPTSSEQKGDTNIIDWIKDGFKGFFGESPTQKARENKISFRIFSASELSRDGFIKSPFASRLKPGLPYAIIGGDKGATGYEHAFFIPLQPKGLKEDSSQVQVLRTFNDSVKVFEGLTNLSLGSPGFGDTIKVLKAGLEIKMVTDNFGTTSPQVFVKENFGYKEYVAALDARNNGPTKVKNGLEKLSDMDKETAIREGLSIASQLYGYKKAPVLYTEEQVNELNKDVEAGGEYEKVEASRHQDVDGSYYYLYNVYKKIDAQGKSPKSVYKTAYSLDSSKGPAQIALNQIAKSNEFVGGTRIRSTQYISGKTSRRRTGTGKSLLASSGGGTKLQGMLNIIKTHLTELGLADPNFTDEQVLKNFKSQVKATAGSAQNDYAVYRDSLASMINSITDDSIREDLEAKFTEVESRPETLPMTTATLDKITDPSNFENGRHKMSDETEFIDQSGATTSSRTYLRTPLNRESFNLLGNDVEANKDLLEDTVSTQFVSAGKTKVEVELSNEVPSSESSVEPETAPVTETENTQNRLDEINVKLKEPGLDKDEKIALVKERMALIKKLNSRAYDTNSGRPAVGKDSISIDKAKALFKKLIPDSSEQELIFLAKAVLDKFAKPGENLLGLYQNGKIAISTYGNSVSERVLRHEIFHKIFNEYLLPSERKAISAAISQGNEALSVVEIEEQLADLFMGYHNGSPNWFSNWFKKLFNKIQRWFNIIDENEYTINRVFDKILNGEYTTQLDPFPRERRAYSDIANFGNVANYKEALGLVRGVVYRDIAQANDLSIPPLTLGEAYAHVSQTLQKQLYNNNSEIESNQELLSTFDSTEDAELIEEIESLNNELLETNAILENLFPKKANSGKRTDKVFKNLWKDLYPNYEFNTSTHVFDAQKEAYVNLDEMTPQELEEIQLSGLKDFTLQSDTVNQESKTTEKVKNFLSFIYNEKNKNKHVNFRKAYYESLRAIKELIPSEGDFETQIRYQAEENGIDLNSSSDSAAVINSILDLVHNATTEVTTSVINGSPVALELNQTYKFLDENTYVDSKGKTVSRLSNQSTSSFLQQIAYREEVTNENTVDPEVLKRTLNASFRQVLARETARELFSAMLSQTEHNFMIAEKNTVFDFDQGRLVTNRKYMSAQLAGEERGTTADIKNTIIDKWGSVKETDWKKFDQAKTPKEKLTAFFKNVLKMQGASELNFSKAKNTIAAIEGFRTVVYNATKDGVSTVIDTDSGEEILKDARYFLADEGKLLNQLTFAIARNTSDSRPTTLKDTQGKTRYSFSNGSQAREMLNRVIRFIKNDGFYNAFKGQNIEEKKVNSLPKHLRTSWGKYNVFVNGLNNIFEIKDHDGIRAKNRSEFGIGYSDETDRDFLERNFLFGYLQYIKSNTAEVDTPKYIQYFYTISNRPRMIGAEVNVLSDAKINIALYDMLGQIMDQPIINNVKNYDPSKMINASELKASLEQVIGTFDKATWLKYRNNELTLSQAQKDKVVQLTKAKLRVKAEELLNKLEFENLSESVFDTGGIGVLKNRKVIPQVNYNENPAYYLDADGNEIDMASREDYFERDDFKAAYSFVLNNYINSYFLNQIPVGNYNFFKSADDLVKRMSGVFAPGSKGLAMENGAFMRPQFKTAIMSDPALLKDEISSIFGDTKLKEWAGDRTELADGQGFMTPARAREIELGYGKAYKAGAVFKPAFYGQVTIKDASGQDTQVPVMVKYSSVVLTDELVEKFPKLAKLREAMDNKSVDELIFDSANKVGVPIVQDENGKNLREMPNPNDDIRDIDIPEGALYNMDNENFRLQMNPASHSYGNISFMTQLAYFMNTGHKFNPDKSTQEKNERNAFNIYEAFGKLVDLGLQKVNKNVKNGVISKEAVIGTMKGDESLALTTIMRNGGSYNLPQIVDKALIQTMNMFAKNTIQPKFKGGHFTLQSSYGVEILSESAVANPEEYNKGLSEAGKNISKNLKERSRRLKYKYIPNKGFVAEVIISREFADKVKAGEFLLPDAMGFRIPSTGLHSSVALQVVGYYDSRESNVIIAPPELVIQHGSDFDVDSLYVLGREVIQNNTYEDLGFPKDSTPGYFKNSGSGLLEFNKANFLSKLAKVPDADPRKSELESMFYRNVIAESFISTISDINNKQVIAEPISPQSIDDAFAELGGLEVKRNTDLSNVLDNMAVFNSNFQGAKLVGIFANGAKALAYMMKAGPNGAYPEVTSLKPSDNRPNAAIKLFGNSYSEFKEDSGKYNIWQVLDALINTSVDNVKDQRLYLMNATDSTGKYYIGGLSLGMPLSELIEFMLQPVSLEVTALKGKINELPARLLTAYNLVAKTNIKDFTELKELVNTREVSQSKAKEYRNVRLSDIKTPEGILDQVAMYVELGKLHTFSEDVSKFSSSIGLLQNMPITYTDIVKMDKNWNSIFEIDKDGEVIENEESQITTKSSFSINVDNLFKAQPNIKQAHKAYVSARTTAFNSFVKHHPTLNALADRIVTDNRIRLSYKNAVSDVKNELFSYLLSSMYAEENLNYPSITYQDWAGKPRVLVGKFAWSHEFAKKVEQVKTMNPDNLFLKGITIDKGLGVHTIKFSQTSGKDVLETFEMQEGFETLPKSVEGLFSENELQDGLVKYAVMNFGMRFGVTNYSTYLDARSLENVDKYINSNIKEFLNNTSTEGISLFVENSPLVENFIDQLVINNPDSLPFFNKGQNRPQSQGSGPNGEKLFAGLENGIWFDRKFMQKDHTTFPNYYQEGKDGSGKKVYKLVNLQEQAEGTVGYYQMLGFKNRVGGYNAVSLEELAKPKIELFSGRELHISSNNMDSSIQEVFDYPVNLLNTGDTVWLYPASDPTRQSGRPAKVVKARFIPSSRKHTVQVEPMTDTEVELTKAEYQASRIVAEMKSRFNVPVVPVLADGMPNGSRNSKGAIHNGKVYLNFSLIKTEGDLNETAFHEIAHPIVMEIANKNPKWYQNLVAELNSDRQGQQVLNSVKEAYPELNENEQVMEAIVTLVGRLSAEHRSLGTSLKNYIKKMKDAIGSFIRNFLKTSDKESSVEFLSNEELADLSLLDLSAIIGAKGQEFKLNLSNSITQDWNSKRLEETENRLFTEGRISFTCKV